MLHVPVVKVGPDQTYPAIDIVAHASGRYYTSLIGVGGADAADAEAVAPVDVGHGQAGVLNAGQESDIGHLVRRLIFLDLGQQARVAEDEAVDAHARLVAFGEAPAALIDLLQRAVVGLFRHERFLS